MPWQASGPYLDPNTDTFVAATDGDAIYLQGSDVPKPVPPNAPPNNVQDVGLTFTDERQRFTASLGFANAPNAWMMGLVPGDLVLMSRQGRVHIGGGPATATPRLMICAADKSPSGRDGVYLKGSLNFTGDPNVGTGEFVMSQRDGTQPNAAGVDFYTDFAPRLSIANNGNIGTGTQAPGAALDVAGDIRVSGDVVGDLRVSGDVRVTGDVVLANADCAEDFATADSEMIEPGSVVVLDDAALLRESSRAYDPRVAGVVSGAGDLRPALRLNHQERADATRVPVALLGRVACKVDAGPAAIAIGDLVTTSDTPGHGMKATDRDRALGAILGKALAPLAAGCGLIPVLVALQ